MWNGGEGREQMPSDPAPLRRIFGLMLTSHVVEALRSVATRGELTALIEAVTREMEFRHYALIMTTFAFRSQI